jgi:hypothetical protein
MAAAGTPSLPMGAWNVYDGPGQRTSPASDATSWTISAISRSTRSPARYKNSPARLGRQNRRAETGLSAVLPLARSLHGALPMRLAPDRVVSPHKATNVTQIGLHHPHSRSCAEGRRGTTRELQRRPTNAMACPTSSRQAASATVSPTHSFMGLPFPASKGTPSPSEIS